MKHSIKKGVLCICVASIAGVCALVCAELHVANATTNCGCGGAAATVTAGTKTHSCGLPMSCPAFTGCTSDVVTGGFNCDATVAGANGCVITKVATPITTRTASSCPTAICALKFNDLSIPYCELHCQAECEETTVIHNLSTACRTVWPAGGGK